jgi:PKD repeat protein
MLDTLYLLRMTVSYPRNTFSGFRWITPCLWGLLLFCLCIPKLRAQECGVIYVTPTGASSGVAGTVANPASLTYGLQLANAANPYIKMAIGSYVINQALQIKDSIVIEGGFIPTGPIWSKTNADSTVIRRSALNPQTNPSRIVALEGFNRRSFRLQELRISVASATNSGMSVYGIYLNTCRNYTINRVQIFLGNAQPGIDGVDGADGRSGLDGVDGGLGTQMTTSSNPAFSAMPVGDPITPPYVITGGAGGGASGTGWSLGTRAGGAGGDGGARGTSTNCNPAPFPIGSGCDACDPALSSAPNAQNGLNGVGAGAGTGGLGKAGLYYCGGNGTNQTDIFNFLSSCGAVDPVLYWGNSGLNGTAGVNGADGGNGSLTYSGGYYIPTDGADGTDGTDGWGGGGGGGGSSVGGVPRLGLPSPLTIPNVNTAGAGGGGGGEGGEHGTKGTKGTGGGGSFCIFLWNNGPNAVIKDNVLRPGLGGAAGKGGKGGAAGLEGKGGKGGNDILTGATLQGAGCRSGAGGNGGDGGRGGRGGDGGDGSTGPSRAIYQDPAGQQAIYYTQYNNAEPLVTVTFNGCTNVTANVTTSATANIIDWFLGGNPQAASGATVSTDYLSTGFKNLAVNLDGIPFNLGDFVYVFREFVQPKIICSAPSICAGQSVNLSTTFVGGFTYSWTIPGGSITSFNAQNPGSVSFSTPGTYPIRLQTTSCCGTSRIDTFKLNVIGTPTVTLRADDSICKFASRPVLRVNALSGATYLWTYNMTPFTPPNPDSVTTNLSGSYAVTITYPGGCSASDSYTLTLLDSLPLELGPNVVICGNATPPLLDAKNPGASYQWLRNGNPVGNGQTLQTVQSGTYKVIVSDGLGCIGQDQIIIRASNPAVNLGPDRIYCPGAAVDTLDAGNPGATYSWSVAGTVIGTNRKQPLNLSGKHVVVVTDPLGCTAKDSVQITLGLAVNAAFTAPSSVVLGSPISFTDQSSPTPGAWFWNFGDGDTSNVPSPTHTYTTAGTKPVFLITKNGFCTDTARLDVTVLLDCSVSGKPVVDFTFTPLDSVDLRFSGLVNFTNQTTGAQDYVWDFGSGQSSQTNPTYSYNSAGTYPVKLVARNFNCSDSITKFIKVVQSAPSATNPDLRNLTQIKAYPNPASESVQIDYNSPIRVDKLIISLFDLQGRRVLTQHEEPKQLQGGLPLDLRELTAGVYLLQLEVNGLQFKQKLIIR